MQRILTANQDKLLRQERRLLEELRVILARLDAPEDDLDLLKRSLDQLDELFLLVVVGEFNAGKTAFLNALLGKRVLKEGVTPTTSTIHLLSYGEVLHQEPVEHEVLSVHAPVDWLHEINLVDTPGTNAVIQRHQEITEQFVPRSDLVLFVTSADRPFSESERTFLERIREWGKKIVIIVNKIDLVADDEDREQILAFVRENATQLLGLGAADLSGQRTPGAGGQAGIGQRADGVRRRRTLGGQPVRSAGRLHSGNAGRIRTPATQAAQPAGRGRPFHRSLCRR